MLGTFGIGTDCCYNYPFSKQGQNCYAALLGNEVA